GSTSITLGAFSVGSISNLHVGSMLTLDQADDTSDTGNIFVCQSVNVCCSNPGSGNGQPGRAQNQQVRVTSIAGSGPWTIGISPGVYGTNYRSANAPGVWFSNALPVTGV